MKRYLIDARDDGRKLTRWAQRELPSVPFGALRRYLRVKRFRVNGKPAKDDCILRAGDVLEVYLDDAAFDKPRRENPFLAHFEPKLRIVYEDAGLLIADKKPGLLVHAGPEGGAPTLLTHIQAYLYQKGEYDGRGGPVPALCNRIDRFTGGLVLAAKTEPVLKAMNRALAGRQAEKVYLCAVHGDPEPAGLMENWLSKPAGAKKVTIGDHETPGAKAARLRYAVLARRDGLSLVKVLLLTGYTHQIRAQFANAGFPILGDGQYGDKAKNARYDQGYQALCAAALTLHPQDPALAAYQNLHVRVADVPFVRKFFPDFAWQSALDEPWEIDLQLPGTHRNP